MGALGAVALGRLADRQGRRRSLVLCVGMLPPLALASMLAPGVASYTAVQVLVLAFNGTLLAALTVVISEEALEHARPRMQAFLGLFAAGGSSLILVLVPIIAELPYTWRWAWLVAVLPAVAFPALRRRLVETARFEKAASAGNVGRSRFGDLFRGHYRRRAIGLLVAGTLRPVAVVATLSWAYYHAWKTVGLSPAVASGVFIVGGALGLVGFPIGARLANLWGRRPTVALFSLLAIASALLYYWIPADLSPSPAFAMAFAFALVNLCQHAYQTADRCLDTEAFPTHLRATYQGITVVCVAVAAIVAQFSVGACTEWLGSQVKAITLVSVVSYVPSLIVFLAAAPETAGMSMDAAALEEEPAATPGS
jgi:putative MFS transporter